MYVKRRIDSERCRDRPYSRRKGNGYLQIAGTGVQDPVRALLQSVKSQKYGCKDLIKIEGETLPERLDILGYLDSQITLIVIREGEVVKKYHPVPPQRLVNVIKCKNPRCITSIETNCDHIFELSPSGRYRCLYCNQEMPVGR